MKISKSPVYAKLVLKSLQRRNLKKFHNNKPVHTTLVNVVKKVQKDGYRATFSHFKKVIIYSSSNGVVFPNGLVSRINTNAVNLWYAENKKKVSIVIPSYNDFEILKDCVQSIKDTILNNQYNLYIVDDYCQEENRLKLKSLKDKNIKIIFRKSNGGFAKAVNTGFRQAIKDYPSRDVILLNSDIVAKNGWLEGLQYGAYQHSKDVGIVGPKLLYPDGRIQSAGSYRNTDAPEWFDHYYRFQEENYGPANVPQYCIGVTGACMYITNRTIKKIGILDEDFQFAFEDMDYCLRAWQEDIKTLYYPASTLYHMESATRSKNKTIKPKEAASLKYFWEKWGDWFDNRKVTNNEGKIRVIYVLQTTGVSGGIRIVLEHLNKLDKMGYDVELWSLDKHPNWMELDTKSRSFKNYDTLIKALSKEDAIKVATWWETSHPVWLSSVKRGIAVNFIQEIESWFYPNDPIVQSAVIACYRKEFINMTTSKYNYDEIRQLGLDAVAIPCGYDNAIFFNNNSKRENMILLTLGRSFFQKNLKQTIEAWRNLKQGQIKLQLFGREPDVAKGLENTDYVYSPTDEQVNELYNQATVFIQTSYHEGFCLPLLEAMATGCPIICTDAHGNRDFCIDGKNCIIVEKDNIKQTTLAIERLFKDKKLRDKFTKEALKTAKGYTWPVIMKRVAGFYDNTASQSRRQYISKIINKI